uniref:TMEM132D_N domain-containing protein n=1 Tax=Steinernema glaseri TaxID=37863 RepID=A0A1I7ZKP6_9BILA
MCGSHFNLTSSVWVQSDCVLPYYHLEGFQACLHIAFAVATAILATVYMVSLIQMRKTCEKRHINGVSMHLGGSGKSSCLQLNPPDSINDVSSGYMNSTYDSKEQSVSSQQKRKTYGNYERYSQKQFRSAKHISAPFETNNYSLASTREMQNHAVNHDDAWSDREDTGSSAYSKPQHRNGSVKSFKQMRSNRASLRDAVSMKNSEQYGSTVSNLSTFGHGTPKEQTYQDVPAASASRMSDRDRTKSEDSVPQETAPAIPSSRTTPDWIAEAGIPHPSNGEVSTFGYPPQKHTIYEPVYRPAPPPPAPSHTPPSERPPTSSSTENSLSVADISTTGMRLMAYSSEPRSRQPIVATEEKAGGFIL